MKQSGKEHRYTLFAAEPVSLGNFANKFVDRMIENYNLFIENIDDKGLPVKDPSCRPAAHTIYMPAKTYFYNAMSYCHILLHEVAHYISHIDQQPTAQASHDALLAYYEDCTDKNIKPIANLNDLLDTVSTGITFKAASPATQGRALAYVREEAKVEQVAYRTLPKLGYELDKLNKDDHRSVISRCCEIASFGGVWLGKEIDQNVAYKAETDKLEAIMQHQLECAAKELGLKLPEPVKAKIKGKEIE